MRSFRIIVHVHYMYASLGAVVSIKPDAKVLANTERLNHLFELENIIRQLVPKYAKRKCHLTATVGSTGDIVVVLEAVEPHDTIDCLAASKDIVSGINTPRGMKQPGIGTLLPAVATEIPTMSSLPSTNDTMMNDVPDNRTDGNSYNQYNGTEDDDGDEVSSATSLAISTSVALLLSITVTLVV